MGDESGKVALDEHAKWWCFVKWEFAHYDRLADKQEQEEEGLWRFEELFRGGMEGRFVNFFPYSPLLVC